MISPILASWIAATTEKSRLSGTRTILVVDDEPTVADTYARILRLEGFQVEAARSAQLGLELAERLRPDAILLDLRMPLVDGVQFLRMLRSRPHLAHVPVAIVTGTYYLDEELSADLRALKASIAFKPLWLEEVVKLAQSLVGS